MVTSLRSGPMTTTEFKPLEKRSQRDGYASVHNRDEAPIGPVASNKCEIQPSKMPGLRHNGKKITPSLVVEILSFV